MGSISPFDSPSPLRMSNSKYLNPKGNPWMIMLQNPEPVWLYPGESNAIFTPENSMVIAGNNYTSFTFEYDEVSPNEISATYTNGEFDMGKVKHKIDIIEDPLDSPEPSDFVLKGPNKCEVDGDCEGFIIVLVDQYGAPIPADKTYYFTISYNRQGGGSGFTEQEVITINSGNIFELFEFTNNDFKDKYNIKVENTHSGTFDTKALELNVLEVSTKRPFVPPAPMKFFIVGPDTLQVDTESTDFYIFTTDQYGGVIDVNTNTTFELKMEKGKPIKVVNGGPTACLPSFANESGEPDVEMFPGYEGDWSSGIFPQNTLVAQWKNDGSEEYPDFRSKLIDPGSDFPDWLSYSWETRILVLRDLFDFSFEEESITRKLLGTEVDAGTDYRRLGCNGTGYDDEINIEDKKIYFYVYGGTFDELNPTLFEINLEDVPAIESTLYGERNGNLHMDTHGDVTIYIDEMFISEALNKVIVDEIVIEPNTIPLTHFNWQYMDIKFEIGLYEGVGLSGSRTERKIMLGDENIFGGYGKKIRMYNEAGICVCIYRVDLIDNENFYEEEDSTWFVPSSDVYLYDSICASVNEIEEMGERDVWKQLYEGPGDNPFYLQYIQQTDDPSYCLEGDETGAPILPEGEELDDLLRS